MYIYDIYIYIYIYVYKEREREQERKGEIYISLFCHPFTPDFVKIFSRNIIHSSGIFRKMSRLKNNFQLFGFFIFNKYLN